MEKQNLYKFIFKLALTYRLSLENICKILGKEPTSENQTEIYNIFAMVYRDDFFFRARDFLFNYDTKNQTKEESTKAYTLARLFLNRYKSACEEGNQVKINKIYSELTNLDSKIGEIKRRDKSTPLTDQEIIDISKYRLKYAISRISLCENLGISRKTLERREEKLSDEKLKNKIKDLGTYYSELTYKKYGRNAK